jgi:hypothetical protein
MHDDSDGSVCQTGADVALTVRGVFDKSHNHLASSARRLVIEAAYPL